MAMTKKDDIYAMLLGEITAPVDSKKHDNKKRTRKNTEKNKR